MFNLWANYELWMLAQAEIAIPSDAFTESLVLNYWEM